VYQGMGHDNPDERGGRHLGLCQNFRVILLVLEDG
jgi:hypothetical protein